MHDYVSKSIDYVKIVVVSFLYTIKILIYHKLFGDFFTYLFDDIHYLIIIYLGILNNSFSRIII
jgi:hypothetical protein